MNCRTKKGKRVPQKSKPGLPALEMGKAAMLSGLQRSYRRLINWVVAWYCSRPRGSRPCSSGDALGTFPLSSSLRDSCVGIAWAIPNREFLPPLVSDCRFRKI